jgi:hypothetical protein
MTFIIGRKVFITLEINQRKRSLFLTDYDTRDMLEIIKNVLL